MLGYYLGNFEGSLLAGKGRMSEAETNIHYFEGEDANVIIGGPGGGIEFVEEFSVRVETDANAVDENDWQFGV